MYEKDGHKYYVVDGHVHFWDARPENRNNVRQGLHRLLLRLPPEPSPEEYVWPTREVRPLRRRGHDPGPLRDRLRRPGDLPADVPARTSTRAGSTPPSRTPTSAAKHPGKLHRQRRLRPARRRGRPRPAQRRCTSSTGSRASSSTPPSGTATRGLEARRLLVAYRYLEECAGARDQEHPRAQGPDDLAAGPRRLRRRRRRPRRHRLPRAELHRRARAACRGWRTSAGSPRRSPTSTAAWRSPCRSSTPGRATSPRSSASSCTGSARTRSCSRPTTRSGSRSG